MQLCVQYRPRLPRQIPDDIRLCFQSRRSTTTLLAQDSESTLTSLIHPRHRAFISVVHFRPGMPSPSTTGSHASKTITNATYPCFSRTKDGYRRMIKSCRGSTGLASRFGSSDITCNCTIQFPGISRDRKCTFFHLSPIHVGPYPWSRSLATTFGTNNPLLPPSAFTRRPPTHPFGKTLRALE